MQRRSILIGSTAVVGLAGCLGAPDDNGGDSDSPAAVVEAFFEAAGDGDADRANSYVHPDSELDEFTEEDAAEAEESVGDEVEIVDTELQDESTEEATVAITFEELGAETELTEEFVLRTHDDEWRLWDVASPDEEITEEPRAAIEIDLDRQVESVTVALVANDNADYVVVVGDVEPEAIADEREEPNDEIRLDAVGDMVELTSEAGLSGETGTIEVIGVLDDRETVLGTEDYDFS